MPLAPTPRAFQLGEWRVDPELNQVQRGDETNSLQPKTMDLLVYLSEQTGPVSTEALLDVLWPDRVLVQAAVHTRIAQIRRALGDSSRAPRYVETIPGRGYRIVAEVRRGAGTRTPPAPEQKPVVAILPLRDMSPAQDLGWLAEGLREHLEHQIGVWPRFEVLPGGLLRDATEAEPPGDADLLILGSVQPHNGDVELTIQVVEARERKSLWAEVFSGSAEDPYDLQHNLVSSVARFFGESMGGWPIPSNRAAYAPFLRLLNYRLWGDADEHVFWLEQTLEADPSWAWGRADLAMALARNSASPGDGLVRERAREVLATTDWQRDTAGAYACVAEVFLLVGDGGNLAAAEGRAREWASSYGFPYAMLLLASGFAQEALDYLRQASAKAPFDLAFLEWQSVARATLGDWTGAQACADRSASLYAPNSVNAQIVRSWSRRGTPEQADAHSLCAFLKRALATGASGSIQHSLTAHLGYYPLAFEIALADGDEARARESIRWCETSGFRSLAAIFSLRLDGKVPASLSAVTPNSEWDGYWWWLTRLHITEAIAEHPLILQIESGLGLTHAWTGELARKASTLPPERHLNVAAEARPIRAVLRTAT